MMTKEVVVAGLHGYRKIIDDPRLNQISTFLSEIDGITTTNLVVRNGKYRLFVNGSNVSRFLIQGQPEGFGDVYMAIDKTETRQDNVECFWENGWHEPCQIQETVTIEIALQIVKYFLEHGSYIDSLQGIVWKTRDSLEQS